MNELINNPILRGMYPDPSICRVGERYYLINSTFAYAPGVPIFESNDLFTWKQIGNILKTRKQLNLDNLEISSGIYAPTIRYHKGLFYMITTNEKSGGNFYVTAKEPKGPWSDPIFLSEAKGIDPSLYFEEDHCYYIGQRTKKDAKYYGDCEIWIQELDLDKKKLVGKDYILWDGASKNAIWPEGPHLYKKDNWYYLMIAEGGTAHEHSVCIARSRNIFGPYESCKNNPVFTHRHLGREYPIQYIGHADLVETKEGNWFAVMLGTRMINGKSALGRETFLVPIIWEDDWPVFYKGEGKISVQDNTMSGQGRSKVIHWSEQLNPSCVMLRNELPQEKRKVIQEKLLLECGLDRLDEKGNPSYIGVRVEEHTFCMSIEMEFHPNEGDEAGIAYFYDSHNFITFSICKENGIENLIVKKMEKGVDTILYEEHNFEEFGTANKLSIKGKNHLMECSFNDKKCIKEISLESLTTQEAGGFVGCTMGVFAVKKEKIDNNYAKFGILNIIYP